MQYILDIWTHIVIKRQIKYIHNYKTKIENRFQVQTKNILMKGYYILIIKEQ